MRFTGIYGQNKNNQGWNKYKKTFYPSLENRNAL